MIQKRNIIVAMVVFLFASVWLTEPALAESLKIDVLIDGAPIHFPGEVATFYVVTLINNELTPVDNIEALLYIPNVYGYIRLNASTVDEGVYRISFMLQDSAEAGFYAIIVKVSSKNGAYKGVAVKGFEVSKGLNSIESNILKSISGLSSQLTTVEDNILSNQVSIDRTLASINASVGSSRNDILLALDTLSKQILTVESNLLSSQASLSESINNISTFLGLLRNDVLSALNTLSAQYSISEENIITVLKVLQAKSDKMYEILESKLNTISSTTERASALIYDVKIELGKQLNNIKSEIVSEVNTSSSILESRLSNQITGVFSTINTIRSDMSIIANDITNKVESISPSVTYSLASLIIIIIILILLLLALSITLRRKTA
ncbi:MAG: hypothetical protein QW158_02410 [Nitrososphaerales archaeon]